MSDGLVAALAFAWDSIRARHHELPPVILAVGPGSRRSVRRVELGHFAAARWSPQQEPEPAELQAAAQAFDAAIEAQDLAAALGASGQMLLIRARQLSDEAGATRSEVFITTDGLARSPAELLDTLLHEAAHAIAFQRRLRDTSRQGRYHNVRFKALAEELGLQVWRDPSFGWARTVLPDETAAGYAGALAALARGLIAHRERPAPDARLTRKRARTAPTLVCECGSLMRSGRVMSSVHAAICSVCSQSGR